MSSERPVFSQLPENESRLRKRREASQRKEPDNQEAYSAWRMLPLFKEVTRVAEKESQLIRLERDGVQRRIFEKIWGKETEIPDHLSPSTLSLCLRWVGYEKLDYPRVALTPEEIWRMWMGTAFHSKALTTLARNTHGQMEVPLTNHEAKISGRTDFLIFNPTLGMTHIIEIKTTSNYGFRRVTRGNLPDYLVITKKIYQPSEIHYQQALFYLWLAEKEGKKMDGASIFYFDRNNLDCKEALLIWNPKNQFEAQQLVERVGEARTLIDQGKLPEPTAESSFICRQYCPYRLCCDRRYEAEGGLVKYQRKRMPPWVRQRQKEYQAEIKKKMTELGIQQNQLPGFEEIANGKEVQKEKQPSPTEEKQGPACGDCGGETRWDPGAAKGGKWVCIHCGNP